MIYNPNCAYEYGVEAGVRVQVVSPWGTPSTDGEPVGGEGGDGLIDTWVPLGQGESGVGSVSGWGSVSYFGYPIDWLYDSLPVLVSGPGGGGGGGGGGEDPPPPPPTITFSPDPSVTANYDSGDVIITAVVSPPGQGWEEQLYWVGEGEATSDPLQRRFSTSSGVGTFGATAVIASQTEASASVKVVPTLVLNPTEITAMVQPEGYVAISAQVFPTGAASVTWEGAGWHWEEGNLIRYVNIDVVGTFPVFARAGESQQQQAVVNVVPRPVQLRLIFDLDWTWNPQNLDAGDDAPLFVPGRDIWPESYTYGQTLPPETVAAGQHIGQFIAVFVDPSNPNQAVPPPAGVDSVQFILEDTTAFKGYATNSGWNDERDDQPDYGLFSYGSNASLPTVTHGFQSSGGATYTYAYLRILDYGGFTRVRAIASNGMEATLELPLDANGNGLPDAGWVADGEIVQDAGQASDDDDPAACLVQAAGCNNANDAAPSGVPNVGLTGDGLTRAEEMRGVRVQGQITPTSPNVKDLFVAAG